MAVGSVENLTGEISYSREHELTACDDILTITSATINLLKPAGDLMLMQGNDTVTITESTIIGDTGVGLLLGSGDDTLTIQNSEIKSRISLASGNDHVIISGSAQSVVTLTALDPDQTSIETEEDLTTLSMGDGDDVLELCAILQGNGVINFGSGSDTLIFNAGTLNNTGGIANLNNLTVTNMGGTTYRDLTLVNAGNRIEWNGNLVGSDNTKWIIIDAVTDLSLADVSFITANNVVSNLGFKVTNRTFTQTDGGTWEISGRADDVAFSADNSEVTLYNMVLTENKTGLVGNNTDWNLNESNISNHKEHGAILTGGAFSFNEINFTGNQLALFPGSAENTLTRGGGLLASNVMISGTSGSFNRNNVYSDVYSSAYNYHSGNYATSNEASASSSPATGIARGGGIYIDKASLFLTEGTILNNSASLRAEVDATAIALTDGNAKTSAYATAHVTASAQGGGVCADNSFLTIINVVVSNNIANNTTIAVANGSGGAYSHLGFGYAEAKSFACGTAQGGGIYVNNSTLTVSNTTLADNMASNYMGATGNMGTPYVSAYVQGGGLWITGSNSSELKELQCYRNKAIASGNGSAYVQGGGVYVSSGTINFNTATFSGNQAIGQITTASYISDLSAQVYGGGIYANNTVLNLTDTLFTDNIASAYGAGASSLSAQAYGGGIYANNTVLNLTDTLFTDNIASANAIGTPSALHYESEKGGALFIVSAINLACI